MKGTEHEWVTTASSAHRFTDKCSVEMIGLATQQPIGEKRGIQPAYSCQITYGEAHGNGSSEGGRCDVDEPRSREKILQESVEVSSPFTNSRSNPLVFRRPFLFIFSLVKRPDQQAYHLSSIFAPPHPAHAISLCAVHEYFVGSTDDVGS